MKKKYKNGLTIVGIILFICFAVVFSYTFYESKTFSEVNVDKVSNNISVNYFGSSYVSALNETKELKFSISNDSSSEIHFSISLSDIKNYTKDDIISLRYGDETIDIDLTNNGDKKILNNVKLDARETKTYFLKVQSKGSETLSFQVGVNEELFIQNSFANILLANNEVSNIATNIAVDAASGNEGLISDVDDLGTTYYFRGKVDNNYVSFADMTWRVVRINGDNTVRLVLDDTIDTVSSYTQQTEDYSYASSDARSFLDEWYSVYLRDYDSFISNGRFCNDNNLTADSATFESYERIYTNNIPTFTCLGTTITSGIGLLTIDEVVFAGANIKDHNESYYLFKSGTGNYWTMSSAKINKNVYYPFIIKENGSIAFDTAPSLYRGVRPVINLKSNVTATGTGTSSDPYKIKEA